ncbi:ABC transporter ATP-binding protein [Halalkalibacterium halodurans]|uniref:Oligopeptide ABC transporter (ATP-binding protein) n=3 Tax=Halalkalibacterium halodurans TaxID=86665 RepID=Q9KB53_HALH5|nr:ABC transporter ATP-binding protein [Halalkalibacterium halodurans]MDY7222630.1 ABC transporter ATP-binding protein [Halalkalibacterium halodurans]MDY7241851.1 ABC transporter ATP-binding protein [Halalkalibacterium halodurans]MED3648860.1 ABC transporter ATP-binding protein [Halalkalibacterium halodurans]MED4082453.1 ABC transporter ATP-binding protein [Halalkalibacterium halodurans]MED4085042.1 ABC transporter ATP-binding protein [Halalkalibacterium halodurans]
MLVVKGVEKSYTKGGFFSKEKQKILNHISFECRHGECLGIIGESGSGKSTLGRLLLGIEKPDRGHIYFEGNKVEERSVRSGNISAVFQDYTSSINPFFTVETAIMEPLKGKKAAKSKVDYLLKQVGLHPSYKKKYPHELSGGEVQRVCIARAISTEPKCIVLDEAISSLDVSIQTQVLDLLIELKRIYQMSYLFITHDIQAAAYICDRIMIFRHGQIEEIVPTEQLIDVQSAYARKLLKKVITF